MPPPRVILVVGASGSGKTALVQRFASGAFQANSRATIGLDTSAARVTITPAEAEEHSRLFLLLPDIGIELEIWELGGRELAKRELPRGRPIDGLVLCYDVGDRASFQRAAHILMNFTMDRHLADTKKESAVPVQLCGTKADARTTSAMSDHELEQFVHANNLASAACTSAKTGEGVMKTFYDLVASVLEADRESFGQHETESSKHVAESWSLTCPSRAGHDGPMTSPRGIRPFEPLRGAIHATQDGLPLVNVEKLVEVLDQHGNATGTRTLDRCLERGLRHRAVHVWLIVPRTGALLLRRYGVNAPKHPRRWGPTVHGEILCYGAEGDGHAAELSAQAAARSLQEQLGIDASQVGAMEHWFSCTAQDGNCVEILDVYVAMLQGQGLPSLHLPDGEEVDWAYFGDVFSEDAKEAGSIFKMEEDYIMAMMRPLRARVVRNDVMNAFGAAAASMLDRDKVRGFPPAGGESKVAGGNSRGANRPARSQRVF